MSSLKKSLLLINHTWLTQEFIDAGWCVHSIGSVQSACEIRFAEPIISFDELLQLLPEGFYPDRVVYYDNSAFPRIIGLEKCTIPLLFYSIDVHRHYPWHPYFSSLFDAVCVAQKDYLERFQNWNSNIHWVPVWPLILPELNQDRDIEICFRGNFDPRLQDKRIDLFTKLAQRINIDADRGNHLTDYPRSKIVINETVENDLNFRVFEATSAQAMLLTPRTSNGLLDLFEDGEEIVTYQPYDVEDIVSKVKYYLENKEEREKIAKNGYQKVISEHRGSNRQRQFEAILENLTRLNAPLRLFGAALSYLTVVLYCIKKQDQEITAVYPIDAYLKAGLEALEQYIIETDHITEELVSAAVSYYIVLLEFNHINQALKWATTLARILTEEDIFTLLLMHALLLSNREADAKALADTLSLKSEELLLSVPGLVASTRERILGV
jgi:hypothetical protein